MEKLSFNLYKALVALCRKQNINLNFRIYISISLTKTKATKLEIRVLFILRLLKTDMHANNKDYV